MITLGNIIPNMFHPLLILNGLCLPLIHLGFISYLVVTLVNDFIFMFVSNIGIPKFEGTEVPLV